MYIAKEKDYVTCQSGKSYRLLKKLGEGGEGEVYTIEGRSDLLAKVYKKNKRDKTKEYKELEKKIQGFEQFYDFFSHMCPNVCWVQHAIYFKNEFQGYICHFARGITLSHWLSDRLASKNYDDTDIKKIAITIASVIEKLHNFKLDKTPFPILVGDLQPQNILISQNLDVSIIDSDSFQIGEALCNVQFPTYVSPERLIDSTHNYSQRRRSPDEENYVLAYLFFQMMMFGNIHPYNHYNNPSTHEECVIKGYFPYVQDNGKNVNPSLLERWNHFSPKIREGFRIAFHDSHPERNQSGQIRRYTPEQWIIAFKESLTYTQPKSTQPKSTQPKSTQPKSTQPKYTQPKYTPPKYTPPKYPTPWQSVKQFVKRVARKIFNW